jgi:probable F420-dependent oxidoreductase
MKLSVEFPSVSYREGHEAVRRFARAVEQIGYDHIDVFDHVVMGHPMDGRPPGPYNAAMPILEALMLLAHVAAVTTRVTLGTEVLVLPQRQPALVAKQISTLDTLSGGRVRLGVGVGWQESEYEALHEDFHTRGARMDEAIALLRTYWTEAEVTSKGPHYPTTLMAMEPKPPQGRRLPIWIGGNSEAAYRRVGRSGDGWLASRVNDADDARRSIETIHRYAARPAGPLRHRVAKHGGAASARCRGQALLRRGRPCRRPGGRAQGHGLRVGRAQCHRHLPGRRPVGRRHARPG